jgi:hypothetical protein
MDKMMIGRACRRNKCNSQGIFYAVDVQKLQPTYSENQKA